MTTPGEQVMGEAEERLDRKIWAERLLAQRQELIGNIDEAIETIEAVTNLKPVELVDYEASDGRQLGVTITRSTVDAGVRTDASVINIKGSLVDSATGLSTEFPMYRVTRITPSTDGGSLTPHYEIAVTDPKSENGYSPLVLIEQELMAVHSDNPRIKKSDRDTFERLGSHNDLSQLDIAELGKEGIYVNPHGEAMRAEVQNILAEVVNQTD